VRINFYDNTHPGADGKALVVQGVYEAAQLLQRFVRALGEVAPYQGRGGRPRVEVEKRGGPALPQLPQGRAQLRNSGHPDFSGPGLFGASLLPKTLRVIPGEAVAGVGAVQARGIFGNRG